MDRKELIALLKPSVPTILYGWYEEGNEPKRPYAVLNYIYSNEFYADNKVAFKFDNWQLDLISDTKREDIEQAIEQLLDDAEIPYVKRESSSEGNYIRVYYTLSTDR